MIRCLAALCALFLLAMPLHAATEAIEVYYLELQEAADSAQSQLSDSGRIAKIPSRRLLVIEDDKEHIERVKMLLKKLDQPIPQFTAAVEMQNVSTRELLRTEASGRVTAGSLPGGWIRLGLKGGRLKANNRQQHSLRVSSSQPASIETGVIQGFNRQTQAWLSGYGVVKSNSVELVPITSGFTITTWPSGKDQVRVRITPWMQRQQPQVSGSHEMLVDLGTARNPATAPSANADMRLNAIPRMQQQPVIEISGATTELTLPLDQTVTIAATSNEAKRLGEALLGSVSTTEQREFVIRLHISR